MLMKGSEVTSVTGEKATYAFQRHWNLGLECAVCFRIALIFFTCHFLKIFTYFLVPKVVLVEDGRCISFHTLSICLLFAVSLFFS